MLLGDGIAQVELEFAARLHQAIHFRLEEAIGALAFCLGTIERDVGALEQLLRLPAIHRRDRDADADADCSLVPVEIERHGYVIDQPGGKRTRILGVTDLRLKDGKFIAAQTGKRIAFTQAFAHALGDLPQEPIAESMAERVVDGLEAIEVEAQHGEFLVASEMTEAALHLLLEEQPVGEIGEAVMQGHVGNLRLRREPVGDVLMDRDPAAIGDRRIHDRDGAALPGIDDTHLRFAIPQMLLHSLPVKFRVVTQKAQ